MSDEIDDAAEWHNFLCEVADEWMIDEVFTRIFPVAENIFKSLLLNNVSWVNETFIKDFQKKYENISLSKADEVSLLMYESAKIAGDDAVYIVYCEAIKNALFTASSWIYLLEKVIVYSRTPVYPLKIYFEIRKEVFLLKDILALARCWRSLCEKYNIVYDEELKMLLNDAVSVTRTDIENLFFVLFLSEFDHLNEARKRLDKVLDALVKKIRNGEMSYQEVKVLISKLFEKHRDQDEATSAMIGTVSNRLFGVFYENQNR